MVSKNFKWKPERNWNREQWEFAVNVALPFLREGDNKSLHAWIEKNGGGEGPVYTWPNWEWLFGEAMPS